MPLRSKAGPSFQSASVAVLPLSHRRTSSEVLICQVFFPFVPQVTRFVDPYYMERCPQYRTPPAPSLFCRRDTPAEPAAPGPRMTAVCQHWPSALVTACQGCGSPRIGALPNCGLLRKGPGGSAANRTYPQLSAAIRTDFKFLYDFVCPRLRLPAPSSLRPNRPKSDQFFHSHEPAPSCASGNPVESYLSHFNRHLT